MSVFDDLVESGTAVVSSQGGRMRASGFRIAPGYVVTAAHVIGNAGPGSVAELDFGDAGGCRGTVVAMSGPPPSAQDMWPYPDLCVLEIPADACPDAVCVLMSEALPDIGRDKLRLTGLAVQFAQLVRVSPETVDYEGRAGRFLRFSDRIVRAGRSGAPLYVRETGAVVGSVKASGDLDAPDGGLATPILAGLRALLERELYLRIVTAHDAYHREHPHWRAAPWPAGLAEAWRAHLELLGLIEKLPAPPAPQRLAEMFRQIVPQAPQGVEPGRLRHPRDLAELVFAEHGDSDAAAVARLRTMLADLDGTPPALAAALTAGLPAGSGTTGRLESVVGVISEQPSAQQEGPAYLVQLFTVRTKTVNGAAVVGAEPERGYKSVVASFPEARTLLQAFLDEFLSFSDVAVDLVEVALPDEYLNSENLYTWPRDPHNAGDPRRLGHKYALQLRRTATWGRNAEQRRTLHEHWQKLSRSVDEDHGLLWFHCRDASDVETLYQALDASHGVGVPDPPSVALLEQLVFYNPLPVMVWRRRPCTDHGIVVPCFGSRFRTALSTDFAGRPPMSWFDQVGRVQRAAGRGAPRPGDEGAGWSDLVLLLERPGHHQTQVGMTGPPMRGSYE